jgi:hypothetical protein
MSRQIAACRAYEIAEYSAPEPRDVRGLLSVRSSIGLRTPLRAAFRSLAMS